MSQLRRILVLVLCCSVFLTAFVVPVSAGKLSSFSGVTNLQPHTFGYRDNSLTSNTLWGFDSIPATFEVEDDGHFSLNWPNATAITGSIYSLVTAGGKKVEFIITLGDGSDPLVEFDWNYFAVLAGFNGRESGKVKGYPFYFNGYYEIGVDGDVVYTSPSYTDEKLPLYIYNPSDSPLSVSRYVTFTYYFTSDCVHVYDTEEYDSWDTYMRLYLTDFTVNNQPSQLDRIEINIGNIQTSIENIEEGVVNIQGTVTDMKEQLEDPDSNIWYAAGEKISDTLEDLFVPTSEEIGAVKDGFDNLAKDKLGGAYSAMETVDDAVTDVTRKLHNPDPNVAIEFPGISVPLGGDVGIVTLAEEQPVTLPTELTAILHPVAGTIFSIICGLGTFNVLKDMVECFLSGYSYAAYLHRNKGGSDG